MIYSKKVIKSRAKNKIPLLVKKVKELDIKGVSDFLEVKRLSESIYTEWLNQKNSYIRKLEKNKNFDIQRQAKFEAQEEIVVGLAVLLNEKLIDFIQKIKS
jgi:hypothetical protein